MASQEKGRPLPKFGEWDVNNPASADGFTVIFAKARDEKKAKGSAASSVAAPPPSGETLHQTHQSSCDNNHTKSSECADPSRFYRHTLVCKCICGTFEPLRFYVILFQSVYFLEEL